jgi:EAL domain-containing protein (putative c-di-GMP-specific phosphodiesterase class I)
VFDKSMAEETESRLLLEVELQHALERNEFELHYQPKADLKTGRVTGVEALLRWKPQGRPMQSPNAFIPILEETGLIVEVGAWVFREACREVMRWRGLGMPALNLAVNLSGRQFRDAELLNRIQAALADTGMDPALLEVELTESMLIEDSHVILTVLKDLKRLGVGIAVDDFGTGYSSLSYLKRFNLDTLKIDRSFVKGVPTNAEDSAIAVAVMSLARSLGLKVVAEGVETAEQEQFLRDSGCDLMQGFGLGRPMQGSAFVEWFSRREVEAAVPA